LTDEIALRYGNYDLTMESPEAKSIDAFSCPLFCRQGEIAAEIDSTVKFQRNKNKSIEFRGLAVGLISRLGIPLVVRQIEGLFIQDANLTDDHFLDPVHRWPSGDKNETQFLQTARYSNDKLDSTRERGIEFRQIPALRFAVTLSRRRDHYCRFTLASLLLAGLPTHRWRTSNGQIGFISKQARSTMLLANCIKCHDDHKQERWLNLDHPGSYCRAATPSCDRSRKARCRVCDRGDSL